MSVSATHFVGTRSVLVELDDLDSVLALGALLESRPLPGQLDVLAAASTILIKADSWASARSIAAAVEGLELGAAPPNTGTLVKIPVHYDGEDLAEVSRLTGMSIESVVNAHGSQVWRAAFGGFAPGFAYLLGENKMLEVPRRDSPRTTVPAGAVALAGDYSAVYPRSSPGGWQLIGHTDAVLWDLDRANPALIRPQDRVQFTASRSTLTVASSTADAPPAPARSTAAGHLQVLEPGLQSLIQDLGRPGLGNLGVSAAGAADTASARQANRLVGNTPGSALIENLLGTLRLQAHGDHVMAVAGATAQLRITPAESDEFHLERTASMDAPFALLSGEKLTVTPSGSGLRNYLSVRGGLDVEPVLGSRSTDSMSGIGPAALTRGAILGVHRVTGSHVVGNPEPSTLPVPDEQGVFTLRILAGPREDWFGAAGLATLTGQLWSASAESNRVGLRLSLTEGAGALKRIRTGELASEGMAVGALQVPPSGLPVLFLADHPVTGGYPVIAGVIAEDLSAAAQLPPGSLIRFVLVDPRTHNPHQPQAAGTPCHEGITP